jgi:EAL domain-containing protein (putative c-di-GMP-specific phosphodiesterase class I)
MRKELKRERNVFLVMLLASTAGAVVLLKAVSAPELWVVPYIAAFHVAFRLLSRIDFDLGRLLTAIRLRRAMAAGQIVMHFQPKVSLTTGELLGVEALARWQHPRRGLLAPAEWLAGTELSWVERRFMRYTLDAALGQARRWREEDGLDLVVCVNVTPSCFSDRRFPTLLRDSMQRSGTSPTQFQLELTETALELSPMAVAVAERLNAMGIGLALDDFGIGHSSMNRLSQLPIGELKIDRRFVMRQMTSLRDAAIVRGAIDLGRALGLSVTAEGVETRRDAESLRHSGCDTAQGNFYCSAVPPDELVRWSRAQPGAPSSPGRRSSWHQRTSCQAPAFQPIRT